MLKKPMRIFILFFSITVLPFTVLSQNNEGVKKLKVYTVAWDGRYMIPINVSNIKEYHEYYFETGGTDFYKMFDNYKDCVSKIVAHKKLDPGKESLVRALVEIRFKNDSVVSLYFDEFGNFNFKDIWYVKHDALFFLIFKYFSNELVSPKVIQEARENQNDGFWEAE